MKYKKILISIHTHTHTTLDEILRWLECELRRRNDYISSLLCWDNPVLRLLLPAMTNPPVSLECFSRLISADGRCSELWRSSGGRFLFANEKRQPDGEMYRAQNKRETEMEQRRLRRQRWAANQKSDFAVKNEPTSDDDNGDKWMTAIDDDGDDDFGWNVLLLCWREVFSSMLAAIYDDYLGKMTISSWLLFSYCQIDWLARNYGCVHVMW